MAGRLKNPTHERFAQLIALGHVSQHAAYVEALGPKRLANRKLTHDALAPAASRLATSAKLAARVAEIKAENERECRWGRKQLLDFYCDVLERGAGTLKPDDRLCQGVERVTTTQGDRTVTKERLLMPSKVDCADGLRKMLGWDKKAEADINDDITELMVMIRRKSGPGNTLGDKPDSIQPLEVLSSETISAMRSLPSGSAPST
jgi:hypothetical protein